MLGFLCVCVFLFLALFFYFASVDTNKEHVLYFQLQYNTYCTFNMTLGVYVYASRVSCSPHQSV